MGWGDEFLSLFAFLTFLLDCRDAEAKIFSGFSDT